MTRYTTPRLRPALCLTMIFLWVLYWLPSVLGDEDSPFVLPDLVTSNAEYYEFYEVRYGIILDKVSYLEADISCETSNGSLVELENEEIAKFLSQALAESAVGYTSLWVGGQLINKTDVKPAHYVWVKSKEEILVPDDDVYPQTTWPFWAHKPMMSPNESYCVAMDRRGHDDPLITALPCSTIRPYICELPLDDDGEKPTVVGPSIIGKDKIYHLYSARLTWSEALSFCLKQNLYLATLENDIDYDMISHRMMRCRPIIENAWISGINEGGVWKWMTHEHPIPTPDPLTPVPPSRASDAPPWYRNPIIQEGCLLADRHLSNEIVFVEAKCSRKRSFICENPIDTDVNEGKLVHIANSTLWISAVKLTWPEALETCKNCFPDPGGKLIRLIPDSKDQFNHIHRGMTLTLHKDIRHVWIGGHLSDNKEENDFYWLTFEQYNASDPWPESSKLENEFVDSDTSILIKLCKKKSYSLFNEERYKCLNLDREDQKHYFMYGLQCNIRQRFICETNNTNVKLLPKCSTKVRKYTRGGFVNP